MTFDKSKLVLRQKHASSLSSRSSSSFSCDESRVTRTAIIQVSDNCNDDSTKNQISEVDDQPSESEPFLSSFEQEPNPKTKDPSTITPARTPTPTPTAKLQPTSPQRHPMNTMETQRGRRRSVLYMTLAIATHFAGYEFARAATVSMFTSSSSFSSSTAPHANVVVGGGGGGGGGGFGSRTAVMLPLAVGCVSPFSFYLLCSYSKNLERYGPQRTLLHSTRVCVFVLLSTVCILYCIQESFLLSQQLNFYLSSWSGAHTHSSAPRPWILQYIPWWDDHHFTNTLRTILSQSTLFFLFVFQSSNVQLLYTQHWSFIGSIFSSAEGKIWFAPIAGVGSLASTIAAAAVSYLLQYMNLLTLLVCASLLIAISGFLAHFAYHVSHQFHLLEFHHEKQATSSPYSDKQATDTKQQQEQPQQQDTKGSNTQTFNQFQFPILDKAKKLFHRVPIMGALFREVILSQCLSSLINFSFLVKVKESITDDKLRAGWTGNCYAWINGISGMIQFFLLPFGMNYFRFSPHAIWLLMPLVMLLFTGAQSIFSFRHENNQTSLELLAASYCAIKVLEYSFRGMACEMLYVDLDYESRYLGKEIINLFANRLGKSTIAITLAVISYLAGKDENVLNVGFFLSCHIMTWFWLWISYHLYILASSKVPRSN